MGGEICIPADRNSLSILNLSDLLTEKHDLTVEDLSTGSNWQTGLPWMELGTEDMPLSPYQSLIISREVEELIKEEFFKGISLYWSKIQYFSGYHASPHPPNAGQDGS